MVENGSADQTLKELRRIAKQYPNTKVLTAPKGYGSAVLAGLSRSRGKYVCYMPSDGQIDLATLPKLWQHILSGKWEMIKIRRATRETFVRTLLSWIFSALVKILFQTGNIDVNGSPRIFLRRWLPLLNLQYQDSFIDTEFAVKAHMLGWRIKEIPMVTLPRAGGKSSRSWHTFTEFFRNLYKFKTGTELQNWHNQCPKKF